MASLTGSWGAARTARWLAARHWPSEGRRDQGGETGEGERSHLTLVLSPLSLDRDSVGSQRPLPPGHYDSPKNSHIPGHYDLPPVRHPPSPPLRHQDR